MRKRRGLGTTLLTYASIAGVASAGVGSAHGPRKRALSRGSCVHAASRRATARMREVVMVSLSHWVSGLSSRGPFEVFAHPPDFMNHRGTESTEGRRTATALAVRRPSV